MPTAEQLATALKSVGYEALELDAKQQTARLLKPGMRLDLGGIAMGYAADEALAVLRRHGFHQAMVDASGDIVVADPPPGEKGWRIGIGPVQGEGKATHYVDLANQALTLSGDAFQHVEIKGRRYSHIVDPKTGLGLTDRSSVTVIAPNCITADSLATAVSVLGPQRGLALIEQTPDTAAYIVRATTGGTEAFRSRGFDKLPVTLAEPEAVPPKASAD